MSGYGIEYLDCYDSQQHVISTTGVQINGASGLDRNHRREIRSSPNCATPFMGRESTGADFLFTYEGWTLGIFRLTEPWTRLSNLSLSFQVTSSYGTGQYWPLVSQAARNQVIRNVVFHDIYCIGTSSVNAAECGTDLDGASGLIYNCIFKRIQSDVSAGIGYGRAVYGYARYGGQGTVNCLFSEVKNWRIYYASMDYFPVIGWNNASIDRINTSGEYYKGPTVYTDYCGWNQASGETADDLNSTYYKNSIDISDSFDENLLAISGETLNWNGGAGDSAGINPVDGGAYYHNFNYFPGGEGQMTKTLDTNATVSSGRNYRLFCQYSTWNKDTTRIRVQFTGNTASDSVITEAALGPTSTAGNTTFLSTPTRITFNGGNNGVTIPAGGTVWSDYFNYSGEENTNYRISLYCADNPHYIRYKTNYSYYSPYKNSTSGSGETFDLVPVDYTNDTKDIFITRVEHEYYSGEEGWNLDIRGQARSTTTDAVWPVGPSIPYDEEAEPPTSGEIAMPFICLF